MRYNSSNSRIFCSLQALLLTTYMKLLVNSPEDAELKAAVEAVFTRYSRYMDVELQQRAVEYLGVTLHQILLT